VTTRRPGSDESDGFDDREAQNAVLAAGTLRTAESRATERIHHHPTHSDDRVSVFWRVFGGTILSIFALVAVTLYNNLQSNVNEVRAELSRANEARAELVKKEEFNTRTQSLWDRMQALQELRAAVTGLKEQLATCGEKQAEIKPIREQLAALEQRLKGAEDDHRGLAKAEQTIAALEQKVAARDNQLKAGDEERKEMAKQLAELRERLAKVEGATEVKPMMKSSTPAKGD
jgi:DNA repair exonuclease SbcCD ATPase subunit